MRITEVKERTPLLIEQLLKVWEDSVKKKHIFFCQLTKYQILKDMFRKH